MKKYYDLYKSRLVCELDFEEGADMSIEVVKRYLKTDDVREISKNEFNKLGEEYSGYKSPFNK